MLFKHLLNSDAPTWNIASRNARWSFYDQNEASKQTAWYLEIASGDIDMFVSEAAEMQVDLAQLTATFFDAETSCVCKLRFPSIAVCRDFCDDYHNKLYENVQSQGDVDLGKAGDIFFQQAGAEPMDWDPTPDEPPEQPKTPKMWRNAEAVKSPAHEVHGVAMGAGDNSFLLQNGQVSVLKNEYGGVASTNRAMSLTPLQQGAGIGEARRAFTPGKAILAQKETEMNMLTPENREMVLQVSLPRLHDS